MEEKCTYATHVLYLRCSTCNLIDLVFCKDAKDWKCPNCKNQRIRMEDELKFRTIDPEECPNKGIQNREWVSKEQMLNKFPERHRMNKKEINFLQISLEDLCREETEEQAGASVKEAIGTLIECMKAVINEIDSIHNELNKDN